MWFKSSRFVTKGPKIEFLQNKDSTSWCCCLQWEAAFGGYKYRKYDQRLFSVRSIQQSRTIKLYRSTHWIFAQRLSPLEFSMGISKYSKCFVPILTILMFRNSRITVMQIHGAWNTKFTWRTWFQNVLISLR